MLVRIRLVATEKDSIDRAEDVRNRLRREVMKRGYLNKDGTPGQIEPIPVVPEITSDQRVPPVANQEASAQQGESSLSNTE